MRAISISTVMIAAICVAGAVPTWAVEPGTKPAYDPRVAFAEADTNHDGAVDHEEFQERMIEVFFSADGNKDGYLDGVELQRLVFPDDFASDDRNHDQRVSLREFLRVRFADFTRADTDDDGVLSVEEVVVVFKGKSHR